MDEYEEAVLFTFALLESRLTRLEYILGNKREGEEKPKTVPERIHKIEKSLQELSAKTTLLSDAQELVSKHKDVLKLEQETEDAGLDTEEKAVVVVERAPQFATTASQLKALDDQQIPSTDGFTKLAKLLPRIAEAEDRHLQQALQISLLRKKNGLLVQRVKQVQFLGAARCWTEWQGRLQNVQKNVARIEFKKRQEEEDEL
ncbi:uncharacterized protein N0V89_007276 [Didymosphaeria variabile]|uniref:Uncharacterized protein n=1 Tax=Didymosphaeria variabile TaxID=1932322 RepID=A0A9W8XJA7_9PLEO|nr:uncharacterized protein N0V89_007276 [Didymosphaeria variabile]KAJ4351932.1 hypothetical protein N0V89_007276 [Didymosphaeria variabile]